MFYVEEEIIVATTLLEAMLGDTVVVVIHPADERYKHLHGKYAQHPFLPRRLPRLTYTMADPSFGSDAVKATSAHDPNDC